MRQLSLAHLGNALPAPAAVPRARVAPTIVFGMRRSGVGLVGQMLTDLGLDIGWNIPAGQPSEFFGRLNDSLFTEAGASWVQPEPVRSFVANPVTASLAVNRLVDACDGGRCAAFLGPRDFLRYRSVFNLDHAWGWADERGAFTLPLWLALFPDARIVHVVRHGVDVAESLAQSVARQVLRSAQAKPSTRWPGQWTSARTSPAAARWSSLFASRSPETAAIHAADLDVGLQLWDSYLSEAERVTDGLGGQLLEIRFEELLEEPAVGRKMLANHCGLDAQRGRMGSAVDIDRKLPFCADAELVLLSREYRQTLRRHGYESA